MTDLHRRFEVTLQVGADDWEALARQLRWATEHLIDHGPECNSILGGYDSHHMITVTEDAEMTPEKYRAALEERRQGK